MKLFHPVWPCDETPSKFAQKSIATKPSIVDMIKKGRHRVTVGVEFVPGDRSGIYTCVTPNKRRQLYGEGHGKSIELNMDYRGNMTRGKRSL